VKTQGSKIQTKDDTPTAVRTIAEALEEDIVFGRLHPQEHLVDQDFVERFEANRPVIRQAFSELEKLGLVKHVPNRGAIVVHYTPEEVLQIYDVRETLEVKAVEQIPFPVPTEAIEVLSKIQKSHAEAIDKQDFGTIFRQNLLFHRKLYELSGNPFLVEVIEHFSRRAHGIRHYSNTNMDYLEAVRKDHEAMIHALKNEDRDKLIELTTWHLEPSKSAYIEAYQRRFPSS
jgi:DNA-binding GntR family transcriptional regulator